jgi:hypothetical protein
MGRDMTLTYDEAMKLYPLVSRRPENSVLLRLISDAIMEEKCST